MEDQKQLLQQLLNKPEWTQADRQWLLQYLDTTDTEELKTLMQEEFYVRGAHRETADPLLTMEMLHNIRQATGTGKRSFTGGKGMRIMAIAATFTGAVLMLVYFWLNTRSPQEIARNKPAVTPQSLAAGAGEQAVLTLADGSRITLDDAANGALTQQGNTRVLKMNGKISYAAAVAAGKGEMLYNTISTPKGKQFEIELPDGSRVWLNAASSLRFPTAFAGKERKVEITGEAYFEVEKNVLPFIVKVKDAEVKVLGTHFNIMAYTEEGVVKTTLLEGAVRFVSSGSNSLLKPGQQSQMDHNGTVKVTDAVNVSQVMAWKNGVFHFEGEDISSITRQLSRWYNVAFRFENSDEINELFYADIPRSTNITEVLKVLELTGKVKFKSNGREVVVMP